eukprot:4022169-Amphidinium_carterae.1
MMPLCAPCDAMELVPANLSSTSCIVNNSPSCCPRAGSASSTPSCREKATKCFTSTTPRALQAPDA